MRDNLPYQKERLVYPGEYIPLPEIEALWLDLVERGNDLASKPLINMDEYEDCFKIEVALPGVRREDIFINMQESLLTILVFHRNSEELKKKFQIHEFDKDYLERHLLLPDNTETEFVSAEYKQGMLMLYIPKTLEPSHAHLNHIVVY